MGFESYHPAINLLYFAAVAILSLCIHQPIFLALSFLCAFAYSVRRNRLRALIFNLALLPCMVAFALYYGSYHHFGVTVLWKNFIGNRVTLESFIYGLTLSGCVAAFVMWFSCLYSVFTTDKIVFLLGKISPKLSLYVAIILRTVPRVKEQMFRIARARRAIGRGAAQGNIFRRLKNCVCIASMTLTWLLESFSTVADSMRSRGYGLRGRSAFSVYRFDTRDRAIVVAMCTLLTVVFMGVMLQQTVAVFDPRIILNPVTARSAFFYIAYTLFCLFPLGLEVYSDWAFSRARRHANAVSSLHA